MVDSLEQRSEPYSHVRFGSELRIVKRNGSEAVFRFCDDKCRVITGLMTRTRSINKYVFIRAK